MAGTDLKIRSRSETGTTIKIDENERLIRENFDRVWNQGEFDTDYLADEYRAQTRLRTHEDHTLEEFQDFVASARAAVPDLHKEIDETIAADEKVVIRYTMTGTQEGKLKGIPPTSEEVEVAGVAIYPNRGWNHRREVDHCQLLAHI